jgi:hypothetical protein
VAERHILAQVLELALSKIDSQQDRIGVLEKRLESHRQMILKCNESIVLLRKLCEHLVEK